MRRKMLFASFALSLFLFGGISATQAITIGFDPTSQNIGIGNTADVAVVISGLGDYTSPSLGTFDLNISFDPTILGFSGVTFGDPVLGDQLDVFGLGSITAVSAPSPGMINFFELSLDFPDDLDNLQAGSFTLATLTFNALSLGSSPLSMSINALGDSWGDPLGADIQNGSVNVVPEPSALLLLGSGLVSIGYIRSRLRKLDAICGPETLLATNTSSFNITAIAAATQHQERVLGLHFFNPPPLMTSVEVIQGDRTSSATIEKATALMKDMGKTPARAKDTPGFIVNRIARPFYNEGLRVLGDGNAAVEVIDRIMREAGNFRMGPFELMDLIGNDINFAATESLYRSFFEDPRFRPSPIQQRMVAGGNLGVIRTDAMKRGTIR